MGKSPLILAALAKDAVPRLDFTRVEPFGSPDGAIDSVLLTSTEGELYVLKLPRTQNAALALDTEISALRNFTSSVRLRIPFNITNVVGETRDDRNRRATLFSFIYGKPIDLTSVSANDPLLESIAKSIAAIHNLPLEIVDNSGLPHYTPQESIRKRVSEVDRAAQTGQVPARLLQRWEEAFEDVALFKYQPCIIHGELNGDHVIESEGQISGVLNWSNLKISDPAEDLSWVVGSHNPEAAYNLLLEYQNLRQVNDPFLRQRAQLYSELEVATWLLYGHHIKSPETIADALSLLDELVNDLDAGVLPHLTSTPTPVAHSTVDPAFAAPLTIPVMSNDEPLPMPIVESELEALAYTQPIIPVAKQNDENYVYDSEQASSETDPAASNDFPAFLFPEEEKKDDLF